MPVNFIFFISSLLGVCISFEFPTYGELVGKARQEWSDDEIRTSSDFLFKIDKINNKTHIHMVHLLVLNNKKGMTNFERLLVFLKIIIA